MRVPKSQLGNSRFAVVASLLAAILAVVGVLVVELALVAMVLHFPTEGVIAIVYTGFLLMAPSVLFETAVTQGAAAVHRRRWRTLIRGWISRPTIYGSAVVSFCLSALVTFYAYVWTEVQWNRPGVYLALSLILIQAAGCCVVGAVAIAAGVDVVVAVSRRLKSWNRPILDGWTDAEIQDSLHSGLQFGRWPDPRVAPFTDSALSYLAAAARENAMRSILFGQVLLLVGGALLSSAVVPMATNAMALLDAAVVQLGSFPPNFSTVVLVPGIYGALMLTTVSLLIGLVGLVLALTGAGRWQQLADLYEQTRQRAAAQPTQSRSVWHRLTRGHLSRHR